MKLQTKRSGWALLAIALLSATIFVSCGTKEKESPVHQKENKGKETHYQCPMHHQIIQDKPGKCPICGMDLVPIESESEASTDSIQVPVSGAMGSPVVRLDPAVIRNIGMRTQPVLLRPLSSELRLNGKVSVDEQRIFSVTARVGGYVEKLAVVSAGQQVKSGETLVELYSPELVTAQQEYLQGAENAKGARERLLNWGVSMAFLSRLEKTREVRRRVPLTSPATGSITRKEVVMGQAVSPGMELFRISDLSEVWITARVYQPDLIWVKVGSRASVHLRNLPDRDFDATVIFISPEMDPMTRTAEIRLKLRNTPAQDLRPEMFAEVKMGGDSSQEVLAVPSQSLIRSGERNVAVVSLGGGRFQPREVKVGRETSEWVEILDGLKEGEEVVVAAQFLIDSESNLRAAVAELQSSDSPMEAGNAR